MPDISMIRGDTKTIYLSADLDGEPIMLEDGDVLYLRIYDKDAVIISKNASAEDQDADSCVIAVRLDPADTESIELTKESTFRWEAEIVFADGNVITPFYDRTLLIKPDKITPENRGES